MHNALDAEHYAAISKAWQTVRDDPQIRCAILTGAGDKAFSAGADIKNFLTLKQNWSDVWLTQKDQLLNRGLEVWKPIIAAVNGFCVGGGMTMLFATDIRVASEHATFGLSEVKRGIIAGNGGTQRTLQQLPWCIGMEMLLTGDPIDAQTAAALGPDQQGRAAQGPDDSPRASMPPASPPTRRSRCRPQRSSPSARATPTSTPACASSS